MNASADIVTTNGTFEKNRNTIKDVRKGDYLLIYLNLVPNYSCHRATPMFVIILLRKAKLFFIAVVYSRVNKEMAKKTFVLPESQSY